MPPQHAPLPPPLWQGAPTWLALLQEASGGDAGAAVAGQVPPDQARCTGAPRRRAQGTDSLSVSYTTSYKSWNRNQIS